MAESGNPAQAHLVANRPVVIDITILEIYDRNSTGYYRRAMRSDFFQAAQLAGMQQMYAAFMMVNSG